MPVKASRPQVNKVPSKDELLRHIQNTVNPAHLLASMEYMFDLILDMLFKMMDTMIAEGRITLTTEEQAMYDYLKQLQGQYHTFTLANGQFAGGTNVLDYMYYFKQLIMKEREKYFAMKAKYNIK